MLQLFDWQTRAAVLDSPNQEREPPSLYQSDPGKRGCKKTDLYSFGQSGLPKNVLIKRLE